VTFEEVWLLFHALQFARNERFSQRTKMIRFQDVTLSFVTPPIYHHLSA